MKTVPETHEAWIPYINQLEEEGFKDYTVHRVASNLYCICEKNQEDDLIWKMNIDIKQAFDANYLVTEGLRLFTKEFIKDLKNEEIFVTK